MVELPSVIRVGVNEIPRDRPLNPLSPTVVEAWLADDGGDLPVPPDHALVARTTEADQSADDRFVEVLRLCQTAEEARKVRDEYRAFESWGANFQPLLWYSMLPPAASPQEKERGAA